MFKTKKIECFVASAKYDNFAPKRFTDEVEKNWLCMRNMT